MTARATLAAVSVLAICSLTLQAAHAALVTDDFNASHTYWNGSAVNLTGTIWAGVQGTGVANPIDANVTNGGHLTIRHSATAVNGSAAPFSVAAVFLEAFGDFDVKVQMPVMPADVANPTHSLAAWTPDYQSAVHVDNIRGTTNRVRFRDLVAPDEYGLAVTNPSWFRLTRMGDQFTGYYGSDGVNWTLIGSMTRAYGDVLRVGLGAWNFNAVAFDARFDNFSADYVPVARLVKGDAFSSAHTYWNGSAVNTSGTMWDGVQGTAFASSIDANITNPGRLTINHNSTGNTYTDTTPYLFDVAALYKEVTGDFDASVQMPVMPADSMYLTHALGAWTSDQTLAVHIDNIRGLTSRVRFRDMPSPDEFALTMENAGWFRLTRFGDNFTGYYGADGVNWTLIGTITRDYPDTLRVGLAAWNVNGVSFAAQFDNFSLVTFAPVPEPSSLVLLGLGGLGPVGLWVRRRRRG